MGRQDSSHGSSIFPPKLPGRLKGRKGWLRQISCSSCLCCAEICRLLIIGTLLEEQAGKKCKLQSSQSFTLQAEKQKILYLEKKVGVLFSFLITNSERCLCYMERELTHMPGFPLILPWIKHKESPAQLICCEVHYIIYPHHFCRISVSLSFLTIWEPEPSEETPALTEPTTVPLPTSRDQHFNLCTGQVPHTASLNIPSRIYNHGAFVFPQHLTFASKWPLGAIKITAISHLQANASNGGLPQSWESTSGWRDFHGNKLCSC